MLAPFAIAWKDLRILARDRVALAWALGLPLALWPLLGAILKPGGNAERPPPGTLPGVQAMVVWGLISCAAVFAVARIRERNSAALLRLHAAPIGRAAVVSGQTLACALACAIDALVLTALGAILSSWAELASLLALLGAAGAFAWRRQR